MKAARQLPGACSVPGHVVAVVFVLQLSERSEVLFGGGCGLVLAKIVQITLNFKP